MNEDLVGTMLDGKFRVEAAIGAAHAGGMVYRGRDITAGVSVVIRCPAVPKDLDTAALDAALEGFLAEASLLARVGQATVDVERLVASGVEVSGHGRTPFCVFEWLAGRSLERDIKGRTSSIGEALAILEPAARALAAAHAMGAAHRDVRPANLWLAEAEGRTRMKVAAFGLATRIGAGPTAFAPEYGAPEHFKASYGAVGPTTDVYGLALTLVEMVSGKRALIGGDAGELYIATSDLSKRPTLRARGAQVSDAVEGVILRALAVDPKRRHANVRELWDALVAAMPELTPTAPSVAPTARRAPALTQRTLATSESKLASSPPGVVAITPAGPPVEDARLGDQIRLSLPPNTQTPAPARVFDKSGAWAWLVVAGLGVCAIAVVVAKLGQPSAKARAAASADAAASAASAAPATSAPPRPPPSEVPAPASSKPAFPEMIRVPAGKFTMGSGAERDNRSDKPAHDVTMTHAFYIDRTEVTAEAYGACVADGACATGRVHGPDVADSTWGCNGKDHPRHPANCVDRGQAEAYCAWAKKRLPTEAEWEYAARGADAREYPWGNAPPTSCRQAILSGMSGDCGDRKGTWEVGTTTEGQSPFGALDMAGNVWEWVADGYSDYPSVGVIDPRVAPSPKGVLRGGSWDYATTSAKTTYRLGFSAAGGNVSIGMRCARDAAD